MNGQNGGVNGGGGNPSSSSSRIPAAASGSRTMMGMGMVEPRHQQQLFLATARPFPSQAQHHQIPSSPHSDSAALLRRPSHQLQNNNNSSVPGQSSANRRPLSVPPQMMDHNYQQQQRAAGGQFGDSNSSIGNFGGSGEFFSSAMNRRPPLSQQPQQTIAEEEMDEGAEEAMEMDGSKAKDEPEVVNLADEAEECSLTTIIGANANKMPPSIGEAGEGSNSPAAFPAQHSVLTMGPASAQPCSTDASESQSPSKAAIRLEEEGGIGGPMGQLKTAQQREEEMQREMEMRQRRREPIVLDWRALEKAMLPPNADEPSPLEHFLLGQSLLARLQPFFEMAEKEARQRERGRLNLPIKEFQWIQGALSVKFPSYPMPMTGSYNPLESMPPNAQQQQQHPSVPVQQCQIHLQLMICPKQFRLAAKLEYHDKEGGSVNCPAESDVRTFERFFAAEVLRMNNEMAVFAFITLCRLSSPPIYASLAQLMQAQMEPPSLYPWRIQFELLHLTESQQSPPQAKGGGGGQPQPQKNVQISIQVTDQCKQFLLILYLRPNNAQMNGPTFASREQQQQQMAAGESRRVILRYVVQNNELNYYHNPNQQLAEMDQRIASIIKTQTELIKQQNAMEGGGGQRQQECCIWPCIRALLEGQHQQQQQKGDISNIL